jgi:hypothetical protein
MLPGVTVDDLCGVALTWPAPRHLVTGSSQYRAARPGTRPAGTPESTSFVSATASPGWVAPYPERYESNDQKVARDLEFDGLGHERGEQVQPARKRLGRMLKFGEGAAIGHGREDSNMPILRTLTLEQNANFPQ